MERTSKKKKRFGIKVPRESRLLRVISVIVCEGINKTIKLSPVRITFPQVLFCGSLSISLTTAIFSHRLSFFLPSLGFFTSRGSSLRPFSLSLSLRLPESRSARVRLTHTWHRPTHESTRCTSKLENSIFHFSRSLLLFNATK